MKIHFRLFYLIGLCCCISSLRAENVETFKIKQVLLIDSYAFPDTWSRNIRLGLQMVLDENAIVPGMESYDLAVRYQPNLEPSRNDIEDLQDRLKNKHYDLIITINNAATDLFLNGTLNAPPNTPILVTAYQGSLENKIPEGMNISGIESPSNLYDNINLGLKLLPKNRTITILTEASADGKAQVSLFNQWRKGKQFLDNIDIQILSGEQYTTNEALRIISELPSSSLLIFHSWSSLNEQQSENSYTMLAKIRKKFHGLILGRYVGFMDLGSDGGIMLSGIENGRLAGDIAVRMLHGENARKIPVQVGNAAISARLDYPGMMRAGVKNSDIPPEITLLNVPPSFLHRNVGLLLSITALIILILAIGLFSQRLRRNIIRRIEGVFNHLPQNIFVINPSGEILYSHVPLTAAAASDSIHNLSDLKPELRATFQKAISETFSKKQNQELDFLYGTEERHVQFIRLPDNIFGGESVLWISSDQTEIKQAHRKIELDAERFRLTLESIGDAVIATDKKQNITLINPVAAQLIGISRDEAIGKSLLKLFNIVSYLDESPVCSPLSRALETGEIVELANHTDLISQDAKRYHIADSAAPIRNSAGEITGGVLVFRDVTNEYNKRDELKAALAHAQNAEKAKSFFIASVSHEIRTPLNSIIGFSELLLDGKIAPIEQKEYIENIAYSGNALLQLINDVLDLSKLEAGKMDITPVLTDFATLAGEAINIFTFHAKKRNVQLLMDFLALPELELDQPRMRQILFNLIGNAVKFTKKGKITVNAEFIPQDQSKGTFRFQVTDTGIGIAQDDQQRLMEPFVQLSNMRGTNATNNGTGLGLSITKRLAEKMHGKLWLKSELGSGSVFGIELQEVKYQTHKQQTEVANIPTTLSCNRRDISILLVDDVVMNLKVLKAMCAKVGVQDICSVTSGQAALEELKKRDFDLVLTDMWMPEMNGAELLQQIRAKYTNLPIIAVTADEEANNSFATQGFSGILLKPITLEKVQEAIGSIQC